MKYLDYEGLQEFKNLLDNTFLKLGEGIELTLDKTGNPSSSKTLTTFGKKPDGSLEVVFDDISISTSQVSGLSSALEGKVDIVSGKGLSTNDFTTDLKNKLDNIAAGATANTGTVTGVTVGETAYSPISGVVTIPAYPTTLPASDVYSWAKAETKPSYSYSEISGTPSSLPASDVSSWAKLPSKPSYTLDEVSDGTTRKIPTKVSQLTNDSGYLTSHLSLSGYATESWVGQQGYLTSHQSLSGYATESWVSSKFNDVLGIDASGVSDLVSILSDNDTATGILNVIASKANASSIPTKVSDLTNDTGFITSYTNTVTSINGKTGEIAAADMAAVLTAAGYALTDTNTWPTALSQLSNDVGYITGITSSMVTTALGYTPPTTDTNTWRPITNTYTGSDEGTSLSQYGANALYNALVNGYASSAGNADTVDGEHASAFLHKSGDFMSGTLNMNNNSITNLSKFGGIYWNPYIESDADGTDSAAIFLESNGVLGGTTLVIEQENDANDTIQFRTNSNATLYHNSYPVITGANIGSQSVNYATTAGSASSAGSSTYSRYVIGDNDAANPGGALLLSGSGRDDSSPGGDTWIYYDTLGGTSSPWGIRHNQANNTIGFLGGGNQYSSIDLLSGYHYAKGFYHNDYGSSAYALTSDGGVALISAMSVAQAGGIGVNNTITYGAGTLLYAQTFENSGTDPTVYQNPDTGWWSHIIMNHANSEGYYNDLAFNFYRPTIKFRQVTFGSGSGWYDVITSANIGSLSVNYATSSGTANTANSFNASTFSSEDDALPENGKFAGYLGYTSFGGGNDGFILGASWSGGSYGAQLFIDTDPTHSIGLRQRGNDGSWNNWATIITSTNIGSQSVNYATTAGSAPASDVYSWAKASTKPSYSWSEITGKPGVTSPIYLSNGNYAIRTAGAININNGAISLYASSPLYVDSSSRTLKISIGNSSNTVCAGNDSRLSDARPASDVYSWAKASTKPSYNYGEINYPTYTATTSGALTLDGSTYPLCCITLNGNISSVAFSSYPPAGHSCHIIFNNSGSSDYTVAIAHGTLKCPEGQDLALTVKAGGYAEIDVLHVANVAYFVRGV